MDHSETSIELVRHWAAWLGLLVFAVGYLFVVLEEKTHLRKSIPMIIAAGWAG